MREELPEEVAARIPAGASRWPQYRPGYHWLWRPVLWSRTRRWHLWQRLPAGIRPTDKGLAFALHYDLMRLPWAGLEDPALRATRSARRLTIVTIRPRVDRLIGQYQRRKRDRATRFVPSPWPTPTAELYSSDGWVDKLYDNWLASVTELAPAADVNALEIEPVEGAPETAWRIRPNRGRQQGTARQRRPLSNARGRR